MNILPKKRWHVRTKENIARVRKDEAEAAEKERQEKFRIEQAEREVRLNTLKEKSKQKLISLEVHPQSTDNLTKTPEHINFFSDLEHAVQSTNKEHDKEVKDKKEEYEKKIGYLTYLGQDTNEALGKKNWYEVPPDSSRFSRSSSIKDTYEKLVLRDEDGKPKETGVCEKDGEIAWKSKQRLDPLNSFKKYCSKPKFDKEVKLKQDEYVKLATGIKMKHQNTSKHKSKGIDSKNNLQKLREARLKREQQEKHKTEMFLSKLSGTTTEASKPDVPKKIQPKYNSQFNPELARQNYR